MTNANEEDLNDRANQFYDTDEIKPLVLTSTHHELESLPRNKFAPID